MERKEECKYACPWCSKGEIYAQLGGSGIVTVFVSKMPTLLQVNLKNGRIDKTQMIKRTTAGVYHPNSSSFKPIIAKRRITD